MSDIKKAVETLQNAKFTIQGKTGDASKRAELATKYITDAQMLLKNIKEKTCTLTWREDGTVLADCSNCGEGQLYNDYNYCPNCGARNINPDGEVDIPPEAAAIGMMHPVDEDHEPPVPEGKDFDGSVESLMQKANLSEEPGKEVEPPFKSITVRPITPPQWVRWGDVWVCSMCGHQMAAGHEGQLPEKCPRCGASMEET